MSDLDNEGGGAHWPASIAPRVHVLAHRKLTSSFPRACIRSPEALLGDKENDIAVTARGMGAFGPRSSQSAQHLPSQEDIFLSRANILEYLLMPWR